MVAIVYTTIGSVEEAKTIAHALVEEQLVACVNIIPEVQSVYRWEGAIEEDSEVILIAKTVDKNVKTTIRKIKELHPYDLPDIIVLPVIGGLKEYLQYIDDETT
jgi:periplasmic divalent cation tolerance protein